MISILRPPSLKEDPGKRLGPVGISSRERHRTDYKRVIVSIPQISYHLHTAGSH